MKSSLKNMVISLTAIAACMGGALGLVHQLTAEPIAQAQQRAKNEALSAVLPKFDNDPSASATEMTLEGDNRPVRVYEARLDGRVVGYAVESWTADGFSGYITIMAGFSTDGRLTGYRILEQAETPGLGAKADEWFCDPTGHRSVIGTTGELAVTKDGGEIDGITAATITSRAFLDAINRARRAFNKVNR